MRSRSVILILLGSCALSCMAVDEGFKRYQIIIDKHPFGEEPAEADVVQIPASQSFARNMRLSMLYEGPGGDLRAGIIDESKKKNYILRIGEIEDGLELVEANLDASEAMLRKGQEVALFKLKAGQPEQLTKKQQATKKSSYAARRASRQATPKKPRQPIYTGEALKKAYEEAQMNILREGVSPPLPLPLTPEMDAQLVAEGVLDPQ